MQKYVTSFSLFFFVMAFITISCKPTLKPLIDSSGATINSDSPLPDYEGNIFGESEETVKTPDVENTDDDSSSPFGIPDTSEATTTNPSPSSTTVESEVQVRLTFLASGAKIFGDPIVDSERKINCNNTTGFECSAEYPVGSSVLVTIPRVFDVRKSDGGLYKATFDSHWVCNDKIMPDSNKTSLSIKMTGNLNCSGNYIFVPKNN